jgi:hypothetical protein
MNGDCALSRPFKSRKAQPKPAPDSDGRHAALMEILKIYTKELPGFPATISPSHAITVAAAKVGDLLCALSVETGQRLGKGIQG